MSLCKVLLKSPCSESEFAQYYEFRWQQLRKPLNLPRGSEQDEQELNSFHCSAFISEQTIIGVGRLSPEVNNQMRLRYMAVDEKYRHQGVGSLIVNNLLEYAVSNSIKLCWLNAREEALKFYQKNGFEVTERVQTNLPIPHYRMEIKL